MTDLDRAEPVTVLRTDPDPRAVTVLRTDAGALVPDLPHLPADVARAVASFDARIASGELALTAQGHPVIPPAAEVWISRHLAAHLPADDIGPARVPAPAPVWGDPRPRDTWRDSDGFGDAS